MPAVTHGDAEKSQIRMEKRKNPKKKGITMSMTEQELIAALGLDGSTDTTGGSADLSVDHSAIADDHSASEDGATAPTTDDGAVGIIADPAAGDPGNDGQAGADPVMTEDSNASAQDGNIPGMPPALTGDQGKSRDNADRRRQYEASQVGQPWQQGAIDRAVQSAVEAERVRHRAEMDSLFQRARLENTFTGAPIRSKSDFDAWERDYSASEFQRGLGGVVTPEALDRAISESPAMKRAEAAMRQAEEAERQRSMTEAQARMDADMAEISRLDPSVKNLEDIMSQPSGRAFYECVQRGYTFLDAFRLANFERLTHAAAQGAAAAAKQQAVANIGGKDHLTQSAKPRGSGSLPVPKGEMELFRELNPKDSDEAIRDYYNKRIAAQK